jgi:hypothetical protein
MQLELPLYEPSRDLEEVARFVAWLYQAGDQWLVASKISAALGFTDRKIRQLAADSRGMVVSGPGCPGYKHVRHCDPEEIATVTARIERQAKAMGERACDIRRQFHRSPRPQP